MRHCLVVAPHPDDETIGAGAWIAGNASAVTIVHITDGSPRDVANASEYAATRRHDVNKVLDLARVPAANRYRFELIDQETYLHLPELTDSLIELIRDCECDTVLAPAYEGGHPDHDSAAFAVARARKVLDARIEHREYRLYHAGLDGSIDSETLAGAEIVSLTAAERKLKRRMLDCFRSQQTFLSNFGVTDERFRRAPEYDFTRAPNNGVLLYERWGWKLSGQEWRRYAGQELARIGVK